MFILETIARVFLVAFAVSMIVLAVFYTVLALSF